MKRFVMLATTFMVMGVVCAMGQEVKSLDEVSSKIPVAVYISEQSSTIPQEAKGVLTTRISHAAGQAGMGATDDAVQFFVTCTSNTIDRQVIPGAPVKYIEDIDLTFQVIDVLGKRVFNSSTVSLRGVGSSDAKAHLAAFRALSPMNQGLQNFLVDSSKKIVDYYNSQYRSIIAAANALAISRNYEEALYRLATIPEACTGYDEAAAAGCAIYQKYVDDQAYDNLSKARTIWGAGLDRKAASEAGEYLALISPDASCYADARRLMDEIKNHIQADIDYVRDIEARNNAQKYELENKRIDNSYALENKQLDNDKEVAIAKTQTWRDVGVAFGNSLSDVIRKTATVW